MKVITIKQPWASLIVAGIKDIENRTWKTNFRGRVLIHAGADRVPHPILLTTQQLSATTSYYASAYGMSQKPVSAIIGSVEIIGCVINHSSIWAEKTEGIIDCNTKEFIAKVKPKPIWNWVLANATILEYPIPAKGKLSFWEYPLIQEAYCHNDNPYVNQGCGEREGCKQNCDECDFWYS